MQLHQFIKENYLSDCITVMIEDDRTRARVMSLMDWASDYADRVLSEGHIYGSRHSSALRCKDLVDAARRTGNASPCIDAIYHLCHMSGNKSETVIAFAKHLLTGGRYHET